jgi:pantothenate kinase-related protein Tda10
MTTTRGEEQHPIDSAFRLWSDDPDRVDLLAFDAIAETLVDAVLDDSLDPVALGVSGRWGSGKTTALNLIDAHLAQRDDASQP